METTSFGSIIEETEEATIIGVDRRKEVGHVILLVPRPYISSLVFLTREKRLKREIIADRLTFWDVANKKKKL